jgi:DNA-binding SARP family transcriptional activator
MRNRELGDPEFDINAARLDRPSANPCFKTAMITLAAVTKALRGSDDALDRCEIALGLSAQQGADLWHAVGRLSKAALKGGLDNEIATIPVELRAAVSIAAELTVPRLDALGPTSSAVVMTEAVRFPERWRPALRRELSASTASGIAAARLLDVVGASPDVVILRKFAKQTRMSPTDKQLGRQLARRLAPHVDISDLGRVVIKVGGTDISGGQVRRKVLALLCFLLTRPRWAATREEVAEGLWPDMSPAGAINSLNQTIYFLRRLFEPHYAEETTAGYLHQESDLLWLDDQLISARSRRAVELIEAYSRASDSAAAVDLANSYGGRFALDFAYEEWSSDFREWLHVGYLNVVETQIRADIDQGAFQRGITIARQALEVEPRNDELELSLLRLLRRAGAHSAAAEQYARYAHVLRSDLGIEPPPPDST